MDIVFVNKVMPKLTAMGTISFQACIDGEYLWCEVSCEALRVNFGAASMESDDLLQAFHNNRQRIEDTARQHLEENGGSPVLLMMIDFPNTSIV